MEFLGTFITLYSAVVKCVYYVADVTLLLCFGRQLMAFILFKTCQLRQHILFFLVVFVNCSSVLL